MDDCSDLERLEIELLLEGIYRYYGFDFRHYVFSTVRRRLWNRVHIEGLKCISELQAKVLHDPKFAKELILDFSITVTEMFRNPSFFLTFRKRVVPLLRDFPLIRIWHAGCSTGEEVYSMAILLYEEGLYDRTRIYATDMNEDSLTKAKSGGFPLSRMQLYTKNYMESGGVKPFSEYYTVEKDGAIFHPFLAENLVFAQHNLATDGSFNEFHVIICRNVMIYFDKTLQDRVHSLFYESLSSNGILGIGSRESISFTRYGQCYEEIDSHERVYRKIR